MGYVQPLGHVPQAPLDIDQTRAAIDSLLILAGQPGTGKTAVRRLLAGQIKARGLGPDDHPGRWRWVVEQMQRSRCVLLECCKVPGSVVRRMPRDTVIVELRATVETRRNRLAEQGCDEASVNQRLANSSETLGYEYDVQPTVTIDTTDMDAGSVATEVVQFWLARAAGGGLRAVS